METDDGRAALVARVAAEDTITREALPSAKPTPELASEPTIEPTVAPTTGPARTPKEVSDVAALF